MRGLRTSIAGAKHDFRAAIGSFARIGLILLGALALSACFNTRGGDLEYAPTGFGAPDKIDDTVDLTAYRLQPLDTISVRVFQVEDLSGEAQLDVTGLVDLPLVGMVEARGLTSRELAAKLTDLYGSQYLQDPDIFVSVKPAAVDQHTLAGAVRTPGVYNWEPGLTLLQAVARAGGTTQDANPRRTVIFRTIDGVRQGAAFDLTDISRGKEEDPKIYADDIIVVDGSNVRQGLRDVLSAFPLFTFFRPF